MGSHTMLHRDESAVMSACAQISQSRGLQKLSARLSSTYLSSQLAEILHKWPGGRIDLTSSGDIARLVLNRPEKSNCFSGEMMFHFGERVKELSTFSPCGVLVVEGAGRSFCSGAELGLIEQLSSPSLGSEMFRYMSSVLATIRFSSMVSVARLHGHCLGGATELASSCDIRVAHKETKIGFLQSRMGIVPSWGGAAYLESIIGRGAALRVMTTAPILTATEAKDIGFVDILYDTEETFEEFVASMTRNGADVCKAQKSMLNAYREGNPDAVVRSVWGGQAQKAAITKQINALVKKN